MIKLKIKEINNPNFYYNLKTFKGFKTDNGVE